MNPGKPAVLILTLGARDIQLDPKILEEKDESVAVFVENFIKQRRSDNAPLIISPLRAACRKLNDEKELLSKIKKYLIFPMLLAALDYLKAGKFSLKKFYILVTDQQEAEERFRQSDTVELGRLIKTLAQGSGKLSLAASTSIIPVENRVTEYDKQYESLEATVNGISASVKKYGAQPFIMAQGGIDAINISLLLRCIEKMPNLSQLVKNEQLKRARELKFPSLFRRNLLKHTLKAFVESFDFFALSRAAYSNELTALAHLAQDLFLLSWSEVEGDLQVLANNMEKLNENDLAEIEAALPNSNKSVDLFRLAFAQAKIYAKRDDWNAFLFKLFTIADNMLMPIVEKRYNRVFPHSQAKKKRLWLELLEEHPGLVEKLEKETVDGNNLNFREPNRKTMEGVLNAEQLWTEGVKNFYDLLNQLSSLRNDVAHRLKGYSKDEIITKMGGEAVFEDLIRTGDEYLQMNGFYVFDVLLEKMRKILN